MDSLNNHLRKIRIKGRGATGGTLEVTDTKSGQRVEKVIRIAIQDIEPNKPIIARLYTYEVVEVEEMDIEALPLDERIEVTIKASSNL